jgi:hypothetical protein
MGGADSPSADQDHWVNRSKGKPMETTLSEMALIAMLLLFVFLSGKA